MNLGSSRGEMFVRYAKALGAANGKINDAIAYAESQRWEDKREIVTSLKAAVSPMSTSDTGFVPTPPPLTDFADFVRPLSILGKLIGLRRVPARVRTLTATGGTTAYWRGEGNPRGISKMTHSSATLEMLGVTAISVVTKELVQSASPTVEGILSRDLFGAAATAMDAAFIDRENPGSAGIKPAAITSGVTPIVSTGTAVANTDADLEDLVNALSDAGSDLQFAAWVMHPRSAVYLSRLRGSGGSPCYPGITAKGGMLFGLPVITSTGSPIGTGSPGFGLGQIVLLDPSQILVTDDGGAEIVAGPAATLQMEDVPTAGAQSQVSMFQTDSIAFKTTRFSNWRKCRDGMAQVLVDVSY